MNAIPSLGPMFDTPFPPGQVYIHLKGMSFTCYPKILDSGIAPPIEKLTSVSSSVKYLTKVNHPSTRHFSPPILDWVSVEVPHANIQYVSVIFTINSTFK